MGWNWVHAPRSGLLEGLESLGQGVGQMRQRQDQERRRAEDMAIATSEREYQRGRDAMGDQRQRTADFQAAYVKAKALADSGDLEGAKAILAPYVSGLETVDVPGQVGIPSKPAGQAAAAPRPQPQTAQPQAPHAPQAPPSPSRTPQMDAYQRTVAGEVHGEGGQPSDPLADDEALQFGNEIAGIVNPQPRQPPIMSVQSDNPIIKARQAEIALNQERARKVQLLRFRDPTGQSLTLDPMAGENAQRAAAERMRAENLRVFDDVVSQMSPEEQRYAATMRPAVGMSREPLRGGDVLDYIASLRNKDTAASAQKAAEDERWRRQQERDALEHQRRLERDQKRPRSAGVTLVQPGAEASGANAVLGGVRSDIDKWEETSGFGQHAKDFSSLQQGLADIKSGNQTRARGAVIGLGRTIMGPGQFTEGEQRLILGKTGGVWSDVQTAISRVASGEFGANDLAIFEKALEGKMEGARSQLYQDQQSFQRQFRQGSAYSNVQRNMYDAEASRFERFGLKALPLPEDAGGVSYGTPTQKKAEMRKGPVTDGARSRRVKALQKGFDPKKLAKDILDGL